jgi:hypothetical protein
MAFLSWLDGFGGFLGCTREYLLALSAFLASAGTPAGLPDRVGLATFYDAPAGAITRSGDPFDPNGMTCAVDASEWEELQGRTLVLEVFGQDHKVELVVNDTGHLYRAGLHEFDPGRRVWRPSERGVRVVVDVPRATYERYFSRDGDTRLVGVWVKEQEP